MSPVLKRQPKIDNDDFEPELSAITMAPLNNQQSPQQPGNSHHDDNNNNDAKVAERGRPKPLNLKSTTYNGVYATASASPSLPILDDHQEVECIEDPLCSARTAQHITFQDVTTASFRIKGGIEYTPCLVSIRFVRFRKSAHLQYCVMFVKW